MSVADEIKARLDLVAYISESVALKKAGRTYKARCPFHQERTPSFVVFPETQTWRCFGACGEGGDIFSFAMKTNGWDFKEALQHLAERAGVALRPRTPEQVEQQSAFERLLGLLEETAHFFHRQLLESPAAALARDYVARRGLNAATMEAFLLGYAPDGWQITLDHLTGLGYAVDDLVAAGVAVRSDDGRVYDRFRHRLVIPIRDGRGRVIGFGARALREDDQPKYLNSPQSDLFDKSRTLFGLDLARREIRETETAVIVEGYMDVMQAHQAGFRNVVAQMGTALTEPQLQSLRRYADRLILALDPDQAGVSATMRGLDVARQSLDAAGPAIFSRDGSMRQASRLGIDMRVLELPPGHDPDALIRDRPEEWERLVREAEPVADYVIRVGTAGLDPRAATVFEKEKVARALLPLLTATESDLHKEANVQKLALRLHLSERRLMEIALESRSAAARQRPLHPQLRQRRRTPAMDRAAARWRQPSPPPPDAPPAQPWEEGPRPEDDEAPPPEDETTVEIGAGEAASPGSPDRIAHRHDYPTRLQEAYCLSVLLDRPERLYKANRVLREVAEAAIAAARDEALRRYIHQALGPLDAEDFHDPAHQVILRALQQALSQDDMEPQRYIRETMGDSLGDQVDELLARRDPLLVLQSVLPGSLRPELPSIQKQQRKQGRLPSEPDTELVDKVLSLRQERLKRAIEELRFALLEADPDDKPMYDDVIDAYDIAIWHLDRTLHRRAQLAHQ